NAGLLPLIFAWVRQPAGSLTWSVSLLVTLLIGAGAAAAIRSVLQTPDRSSRLTAPFAVVILLCVPLVELTAFGMGYNSRHTLAVVPALFMLAGFGFASIACLLPAGAWAGPAAIVTMLMIVGWKAADSVNMARIARSEGEWAI